MGNTRRILVISCVALLLAALVPLIGIQAAKAGPGLAVFPESEWQQTYGGSGEDYAICVQQTTDGGYIMSGSINDNPALIKTYVNGTQEWQQTYSVSSAIFSVQQTSDGGYIFCASPGLQKATLTKTNNLGEVDWQQTYGVGQSAAYSVLQNPDGSYVFCGYTDSLGAGSIDAWLVKTNADGKPIWQRTYGGSGTDGAYSVQRTSDGGYALCGTTSSLGSGQVYLVRTDGDGNQLWENHYFSGNSIGDNAASVRQTDDGGFILCGPPSISATPYDAWMLRTDAAGNQLWRKSFDWSACDNGASAIQTPDGGFLMCGFACFPPEGDFDAFLLKTDAWGNLLWQQTYGGSGYDGVLCLAPTSDGGYVMCGGTTSSGAGGQDAWLIKLPSEGPPPLGIESLTPSSGPTGIEVTISGYGFGDTQDPSSRVSFSLVEATGYTSWTDTQIVCQVPAGTTGRVIVRVTTSQGSSNGVPLWMFDIPEGEKVKVEVEGGFTFVFDDVNQPGVTTVTPQPDPVVANFEVLGGSCYDIFTSADFEGSVEVSLPYDDTGMTLEEEQDLRLLHYDEASDTWDDVTSGIDIDLDIIRGVVQSFSDFVIARRVRQATTLSMDPLPSTAYSDTVQVKATLKSVGGEPLEGKTISFALGGQSETDTTDDNGMASVILKVDTPQGTHEATASFAQDDLYLTSQTSADLEVTRETAILQYTGAYLVKTGESIPLSATLSENDASPGVIAEAGSVVFEVYDLERGTKVGEASASVTETSPGKGMAKASTGPLPANLYRVRTYLVANDYYQAPEPLPSDLSVYNPQGGFTAGAGSFIEGGIAKTFGFDVKYGTSGPLVPKGHFSFTAWTSLWHPRKVEATSFVYLVIPSDKNIAYVLGYCRLDGVGGYSFLLKVEDAGWLFGQDTFQLLVKNADNQTVYQAQGKVSLGGILVHH